MIKLIHSMNIQVKLGKNGVDEVLGLGPMSDYEKQGLELLIPELKSSIEKGIKFAHQSWLLHVYISTFVPVIFLFYFCISYLILTLAVVASRSGLGRNTKRTETVEWLFVKWNKEGTPSLNVNKEGLKWLKIKLIQNETRCHYRIFINLMKLKHIFARIE